MEPQHRRVKCMDRPGVGGGGRLVAGTAVLVAVGTLYLSACCPELCLGAEAANTGGLLALHEKPAALPPHVVILAACSGVCCIIVSVLVVYY